jgi:hypothetical protein
MPSDVAVEIVSQSLRAEAPRRLPIGVGLSIGAGASIALWTCIAFSLHALFA